jgi:hypothetical protein
MVILVWTLKGLTSVETLDFLIKLCVIVMFAGFGLALSFAAIAISGSKLAFKIEGFLLKVTGCAWGSCIVLCLIKLGSFL